MKKKPEITTEEWLAELERLNIVGLVDDDGVILNEYWVFAFADTADEGEDNFAMPIFYIINNKPYLVDCIFDKNNLTIQERAVFGKAKEHKISKIVIETNSFGAYFVRRLRELMPNVEIYGQNSSNNKMSRILNNSGLIKKNFYFPENLNENCGKFMDEVFRILKTSKKKDDAPDSLSGACAHLETHYRLF